MLRNCITQFNKIHQSSFIQNELKEDVHVSQTNLTILVNVSTLQHISIVATTVQNNLEEDVHVGKTYLTVTVHVTKQVRLLFTLSERVVNVCTGELEANDSLTIGNAFGQGLSGHLSIGES